MNKESLKNISEYLYELGCNLDDELEMLEKELCEIDLKISILLPVEKQYLDTKKIILNDFLNDHLKQEEYSLCLKVADNIFIKTAEVLVNLRDGKLVLKGKIDSYKLLINKIKNEYDDIIAKIRSFKVEKQEEKIEKREVVNPIESLLRRPVGTHPGNLLAERKKNG